RPAHRRAPGLVQGAAATPRVPAHRRVHRRAAQDHHRQDPALQAARGPRATRGPSRRDGRMIDGIPLGRAHLHAARRPTLKVDWQRWALEFGRGIPFEDLYDPDGTLRPDRFDAYLEAEGVDVAPLLSEHSPRVTAL